LPAAWLRQFRIPRRVPRASCRPMQRKARRPSGAARPSLKTRLPRAALGWCSWLAFPRPILSPLSYRWSSASFTTTFVSAIGRALSRPSLTLREKTRAPSYASGPIAGAPNSGRFIASPSAWNAPKCNRSSRATRRGCTRSKLSRCFAPRRGVRRAPPRWSPKRVIHDSMMQTSKLPPAPPPKAKRPFGSWAVPSGW
jgi:hypothetical protein